MNRLDEINALAESSPGFVWRLQTSEGNATYFRPFDDDDQMLLNMSVWETSKISKHYVTKTAHAELLRQRSEWFEKIVSRLRGAVVGAGQSTFRYRRGEETPGVPCAHGPTEFAFTFKAIFPPDHEFQRRIDWSSFQPCPATT